MEIKKDVLSKASHPSKLGQSKEDLVLQLQIEQYKMQDYIYLKFGVEYEAFEKACERYDVEDDKESKNSNGSSSNNNPEQTRDVTVIINNLK